MSPARCAPWLWLLTGLFAIRVAAQPAALVFDRGPLPPFDSWHGDVVPYPLLLLSQAAILAWMARTAHRFAGGAVVPRRGIGRAAVAFGGAYFAAMFLRLVLGLTVLGHLPWFARPLPAFFHLVLASYVMLYGRVHLGGAAPASESGGRGGTVA